MHNFSSFFLLDFPKLSPLPSNPRNSRRRPQLRDSFQASSKPFAERDFTVGGVRRRLAFQTD